MEDECLELFNPIDLRLSWPNSVSRPPYSLKELKKAKTLVLAHCTSSIFLDEIVKKGLLPYVESKRRINDDLFSDEGCVYLLSTLDRYFLERATKHYGGEGIVVVVKVERNRLEADENIFPPVERGRYQGDEALYLSLCFGQCKHRGRIMPQQIVGIYKADGSKIWPINDETKDVKRRTCFLRNNKTVRKSKKN